MGEGDPPVDAMAQIEDDSRAPESLPISYLVLDEIRRDGGTQPRAAIDLKHVKLLEEQMEDGKELEPVIVFHDGSAYWLADGFHRFCAHRNRDRVEIACIIHSGSQRDAILYSVGANADHKPALPRSREDKRRAIMTLLQDSEWGKWSDREIARQCKVSDKTVGSLRKSICGNSADTQLNIERKVQRGSKIYTVNTANIGKATRPQGKPPAPSSRVTVTTDHPFLSNQSGTIAQIPNLDAAIVELDTGERELIPIKHLQPATARHLKLVEGELVQVYAPDRHKVNGRWGRIAAVKEYNVEVWLRDVDAMTMQKHTLKHQQVTPLPLEKEPRLKEISDRLSKLRSCGLDPFEVEILNLLERPVVFTRTELEYLAHIEKRHGIV